MRRYQVGYSSRRASCGPARSGAIALTLSHMGCSFAGTPFCGRALGGFLLWSTPALPIASQVGIKRGPIKDKALLCLTGGDTSLSKHAGQIARAEAAIDKSLSGI